jgi:hypothetical protein
MDHLAVGVGIGVAIGIAIGLTQSSRSKKSLTSSVRRRVRLLPLTSAGLRW